MRSENPGEGYPQFYQYFRPPFRFADLVLDYGDHLFSSFTDLGCLPKADALACARWRTDDEKQVEHANASRLWNALFDRIAKIPADSDEARFLDVATTYIDIYRDYVNPHTDDAWTDPASRAITIERCQKLLLSIAALPEASRADMQNRVQNIIVNHEEPQARSVTPPPKTSVSIYWYIAAGVAVVILFSMNF